MGDYARGLVSYTIAVRVSGRLQSRCIRTALCLFMRARRLPTHTKRYGDRGDSERFAEVTEESNAHFDQQCCVVPPPQLSIRL